MMEGLLWFSEQMPGVPSMTHDISSTLQMQILLLPFFSGEGTGSERFRHTARDREAGLEQGPSGLEDQGLGILPVWWLWSLPRNLINQLKPTYTSFTGTKKLDSCHCLQSS